MSARRLRPTRARLHVLDGGNEGRIGPFDDSLGLTALAFLLGAAGVWVSGARLSSHVDLLAERWSIGEAFAGALLLGGATSLPELATTLSAAGSGAGELAGGNLLGGVVAQIAVLALVDALLVRRRALTFFAPTVAVLVQGVFLIVMVAMAAAVITSGELVTVAGVGLWPVVLAVTYGLGLALVRTSESHPRWAPTSETVDTTGPTDRSQERLAQSRSRYDSMSTAAVGARFAVAALGVLVSGFVVARTGESIAAATGIGETIVGATAVSITTSLPEISTTSSAIRIGAYSMAVANILGTNALEIALFLPADIAYRDGSIIDAMRPSSAFLAALGALVTAVYVWGILERRDRTIVGMGWDSLAVLVVAFAGMGVFATL